MKTTNFDMADFNLDDAMDAFDIESLEGFGGFVETDGIRSRYTAPIIRRPVTGL